MTSHRSFERRQQKTHFMKFCLIVILLFASRMLKAQQNDTIYLKKDIPIKNGYFLKSKDSVFSYKAFKNPTSGIIIYPSSNENDTVYSLTSGKVRSIVMIEDGTCICLIQHGNLIYAYGNLDYVFLTKGSAVDQSRPIGKISSLGSTSSLHLVISKLNHQYLSLDEHIKLMNVNL